MQQIGAKVPDGLADDVEEHAEAEHGGNTSEAVRDLLRRGVEHDERMREQREEMEETIADLRQRLDHAEARRDDLERQLAEVRVHEDRVEELVEHVDADRTLRERREHAGLLTRTKWWLTGMPDESED